MEIKTTEDIMYEYVDCNDGCLSLYDINPNVKWVQVNQIIKALKETSKMVSLDIAIEELIKRLQNNKKK